VSKKTTKHIGGKSLKKTVKKESVAERVTEVAQGFRDIEIEYQLMAYLTRSDASGCGMMQVEWLSDIILRDVFIVVSDLRIKMSKAMLLNELRDRNLIRKDEEGIYEDAVDELFKVDVSGFNQKNTRHMMNQILRLSETRKVLIGCGAVIGQMRKFDLDDAKRKLSILSKPMTLVDRENAGFYLEAYGERVEILEEKQRLAEESETAEAGILTGIGYLDKKIGGVMRKEFGIVAGITGVGKTAALINFGVNAWLNGQDVMLVSGEMAKDLVEFRIDSFLTGIHGMKFRKAELDNKDHKRWDSVIKKYKATQESYLYTATYPRQFTIDNVERDMLRLQEETGRKATVICVDYINIMKSSQRGKGSWEDQAEVVWEFKGFVAEHNLVGWTAGQVKDEAYEKELYDPSDLKYARAISECAPIIIALIRTTKDVVEQRMKLQVLKMRNASLPSSPLALSPNLEIMKLHEEKIGGMKDLSKRPPDTVDMTITQQARPKKKKSYGR
jgi:replicative DNA helicase